MESAALHCKCPSGSWHVLVHVQVHVQCTEGITESKKLVDLCNRHEGGYCFSGYLLEVAGLELGSEGTKCVARCMQSWRMISHSS